MLRSCVSKNWGIRFSSQILNVPRRSICDTVDEELQQVIDMYKNKIKINLDHYSHPALYSFMLTKKSNTGEMTLTRQFGKNETVRVQFQIDNLEDTPLDYDDMMSQLVNPNPVHPFQILLSVPNQPNLRLFANTLESSDEILISSAAVEKGINYNYTIDVANLAKNEKNALHAYVEERIGENFGQFIREYTSIVAKQHRELWFKDVQTYIAGQKSGEEKKLRN